VAIAFASLNIFRMPVHAWPVAGFGKAAMPRRPRGDDIVVGQEHLVERTARPLGEGEQSGVNRLREVIDRPGHRSACR